MSDEEILRLVADTYANPSNWEPYEKDYGVGRPVMRQPWGYRDKGQYAQIALKYIEERKHGNQ
jgi:hypothetical protein